MRCISCENFSLKIICNHCQEKLLRPSVSKRELDDGFVVYSFYKYDEIKKLVDSKYYFHGDRVYQVISKLSFGRFKPDFKDMVTVVPIDDHTRHGFSPTAILAKNFQHPNLKAVYGTLQATNHIKYAGKSLLYRQKHKRGFLYKGKKNLKIILVDDIVTTGLTILEAKLSMEKNGCEVLFAITLSDAKQ
ncbi:MAG: phosphoribosyltransferase [Campylobacteraceae bacterium 4484_166]|nr:MAG: phosphoribosyltransferase [Campylobacteraceae bacterium 4484_166]